MIVLFYTESEQVCKFIAAVPLGITETKRKMRSIFLKFQYILQYYPGSRTSLKFQYKTASMKILVLAVTLTLASFWLMAGEVRYHRTISWKALQTIRVNEEETFVKGIFDGAQYKRESGGLPIYSETFSVPITTTGISATIENAVFDVAPDGFPEIDGISQVKQEIEISAFISFNRKIPYTSCSFVPVRINPYNSQYEVLISFDIVIQTTDDNGASRSVTGNYAANSVLSSGDWYKLSVVQTGIHQITYSDLQSMGINPALVDPRNIRLYGNGGGMLSESLTEFRHDDLVENNIFIAGENDGKFDQQDYILFYGESPHKWKYQPFNQAFNHEQNLYSDSTYYFLTADLGAGKRVTVLPSAAGSPNVYVSKFTDFACHDRDLFNLANIGRDWYGEVFDVSTSFDFSFNFPDIDLSSPAYFRAYVAAKSQHSTSFKFLNGNSEIMSAVISGIPSTSNTEARSYVGSDWFTPASADIKIRINYQKNGSSATGWLNYIELNVVRNLIFSGAQMSFRDPASAVPGTIAEFTVGNAGQNVQIWNVTDPTHAQKVETVQSGNNQVFRLNHDTLAEFIAFNGSSYFPVKFEKKAENQNLHAAGPQDMIIITHPLFREQADRLAAFHTQKDGLTVLVTEIDRVYNEFSSGAQDITAIRNFMKLLYDSAPSGEEPRYLLLFGDASFDYKDRIENNSNFVPTWEDNESLIIVYSIASDDYYGFLDGPGDNLLDIGIGRLPVQTTEQATIAVDKIIHYATHASVVMKDWRNFLCFVADDEDGNQHLDQAEEMATYIDTKYGVYNIDKIYVDASPQISTPGGQRSPEVNSAINNRIDKGCLIMNYTGHGGEVGWGTERFLANSDINSWSNYDRMPIFITATCEFSRYDDPERISAGEYVYLNPNGGAIAMFTTARATFGGSNFNLNQALFDFIFEENEGEFYCFGDLIRLAKNEDGVDNNDKKFILLGDPALQLAYPMHEVVTTRINDEDVASAPDTLQALRKITVEGEVLSSVKEGNGFNGTVYPIVFDKPSLVTTLASDPNSYQKSFNLQNNILYKGKAQVTDGKFSFTFIVPKDIAYQYGFGKISYYAANEEEDAHGFYRNILVGGLDQSVDADITGPAVELFINDRNFIFGGITDENPDMLAYVSDASGINTVGIGIGHDIVMILDGNTDKPIILNSFYESDINSYTSGTIRYPFHNLEEGLHTLSLKVWDVFNNSSDAYLEFNVISSDRFIINELMNYPNPFTEGTSFVFSHNQAEGELDVNLNVFSLNGQIVKSFETNITPAGYRSEPIYWDGRDDSGAALSKGMYLYRISVRNEAGQTDGRAGKLILLR